MTELNFDDPETEERWCEDRRAQVVEYLKKQRVKHGRVGEWPAWHVAPYISIWAVENKKNPEWVGWWVICGDLPTDYISSSAIKNPRDAMQAFAKQWLNHALCMKRGACDCDTPFHVGKEDNQLELAPLLEARGKILLEFSKDDSYWEKTEDGF